MNKYERIQLVRALGLNTEVSVLVSSESDWNSNAAFLSQYPRYSVRTFREGGLHLDEPHFPIVGSERLRAEYKTWLSQGLHLIVAEPVDPDDAELAGCLLIEGDSFLAEVAHGPGTVRRVTHESRVDARFRCDPLSPESGNFRVDRAVYEAGRAIGRVERPPYLNLQGLVFEFSWYRLRVGWKSQPLIFWEVSGSAEQESFLEGRLGEV